MRPVELLGGMGHAESCFGLLGDNVGVGASRYLVCAKRTTGSEIIWDIMMVLLRDEAQVEARFGPLGDSANLDADRCTVCAKHTIGSLIILDAPDRTPR